MSAEELFQACQNRDLSLLHSLLNTTAKEMHKINARDAQKKTLMHVCVENDFASGVRILIEKGAMQTGLDQNGQAPIHIAIEKGDAELVELLIEKGCYFLDSKNRDCLHYAILNGNRDVFNLVFANYKGNSVQTSNRDTLLISAAKANKFVLEMLAQKTIECVVDQIDYSGWAAIHYVAKNKNLEFLKSLIVHEVNPNLYNLQGETALLMACKSGWEEGVKYLVENNYANITCRDREGNTPSHMAAEGKHTSIYDFLRKHPLSPFNEKAVNKQGFTPEGLLTGDLSLTPVTQKIKVQLISDVHLEFQGTHNISQSAPYLVLAGDIGVVKENAYKEFLFSMAEKYEKVFVLAGNHEFYGSTVEKTMLTMKNICNEHPNLFFLNRTRYMLAEKVRLIGTVLWSDIPEEYRSDIQWNINDYFKITSTHITAFDYTDIKDVGFLPVIISRKITPTDTTTWFEQDVKWIQEEIEDARAKGEQLIIATHHAPVMDCGNSDGEYEVRSMAHAFCSSLSHLFGDPVTHWLFGHTHWFYDITISGTRVVNNPEGYPSVGETLFEIPDCAPSEKIPYDGQFFIEV